nr:ribonuclease H-like domain-containing protein [Tanacetum cinerariifolium]
MLKQGDYEMRRLRIEQYFQVQDYALWDVLENGNSFKPVARTTTNDVGTSTTLIPETRFGGNEATKKTRKILLKSLPSEWNANVVVWRNKYDLDTMSIDDLYNNFKIVKQEVKRTASSNSSSQNMDFVSSPSTNSTNKVYTAYGVSTPSTPSNTASTQVSTASSQTSTANLSDATVYAFLSNQSNGSQLVHEDHKQIHEDELEEINLKWHLALLSMREKRGPRNQDSRNKYQDNSKRTMNVEETHPKAMVAIDGIGFDWIYMAEDEPQSESYGPKSYEKESKNASKDIPNELKESSDALLVNVGPLTLADLYSLNYNKGFSNIG